MRTSTTGAANLSSIAEQSLQPKTQAENLTQAKEQAHYLSQGSEELCKLLKDVEAKERHLGF